MTSTLPAAAVRSAANPPISGRAALHRDRRFGEDAAGAASPSAQTGLSTARHQDAEDTAVSRETRGAALLAARKRKGRREGAKDNHVPPHGEAADDRGSTHDTASSLTSR
jgi:hypothetical protein